MTTTTIRRREKKECEMDHRNSSDNFSTLVKLRDILIFPTEVVLYWLSDTKERGNFGVFNEPLDIDTMVRAIGKMMKGSEDWLGEQVVQVTSIASLPPLSRPNDDDRNGDRIIMHEVIKVLHELYLENVKSSDSRRRQRLRLTATTTTSVSIDERYWHHTIYWLCEILAVICVKFTIVLHPTPLLPAVRRDGSTTIEQRRKAALTKLLQYDCSSKNSYLLRRREIYVQVCSLRWRIATALSRTGQNGDRCFICTHEEISSILYFSDNKVFMLPDVVGIAVACECVRLYRQWRQRACCGDPTKTARCDAHRNIIYGASRRNTTTTTDVEFEMSREFRATSGLWFEYYAPDALVPKDFELEMYALDPTTTSPYRRLRALYEITLRLVGCIWVTAARKRDDPSINPLHAVNMTNAFFNCDHLLASVIIPLISSDDDEQFRLTCTNHRR